MVDSDGVHDLRQALDELRALGWADEADALEAMASHLLRTMDGMRNDTSRRRRRYQAQQLDRMREHPDDPAWDRWKAESARRSNVMATTRPHGVRQPPGGGGDLPPAA